MIDWYPALSVGWLFSLLVNMPLTEYVAVKCCFDLAGIDCSVARALEMLHGMITTCFTYLGTPSNTFGIPTRGL